MGCDAKIQQVRAPGQEKGFSLLELVFVVAIIGIIVSFVAGDVRTFNRTYKVRNDADSLADLITLARMRAASTFARVQVLCSNTTNQCSLQNKPYGATTWAADSNQQTVSLSTGVSFGTPTGISTGVGGQSSVTPYEGSKSQSISYATIFNSRGLPIADNANGTAVSDYALYLVGPDNSAMAISVDASGKASIYNLNGSSWQLLTN